MVRPPPLEAPTMGLPPQLPPSGFEPPITELLAVKTTEQFEVAEAWWLTTVAIGMLFACFVVVKSLALLDELEPESPFK